MAANMSCACPAARSWLFEAAFQEKTSGVMQLLNSSFMKLTASSVSGELIEIDARPSDAVALAVHYTPHLPIYVASEVLDEAAG